MTEPDLDDIGDIEAAFASIQREAATTATRANRVLRLADALAERDFGDAVRQADLRERYLLAVLEHPDELPLDVENAVLGRLGDPAARGREPGERWAARRRRLGRAWLRTLDRHASVLNEDFDEDAIPQLNVRPPAATGLPSGVAPETIEDPDLRASYEAEIAKNRRAGDAYRGAHEQRLLARAIVAKAEQRAIDAYAADPPALHELSEDVELVGDGDTRRRILDEVRSRTS